MVVEVLEPLMKSHRVTGDRMRNRIDAILRAATRKGLRTGESPAAIESLRDDLAMPTHEPDNLPAMALADLPAFWAELLSPETFAKHGPVFPAALAFTIVTAARTSEVTGAMWPEIDMAEGLWTIPKARMKARREHVVVLSNAAMDILRTVPREAEFEGWNRGGAQGRVFIGSSPFRGVGRNMIKLLHRLRPEKLSVHGFRSCFSTWAYEKAGFDGELIEIALAHSWGNKVMRAYARGDRREKRRKLMEAWSGFLASASQNNVIRFASKARRWHALRER